MYNSIVAEYKNLLGKKMYMEQEIKALLHGYISYKTINGNRYAYLQSRTAEKITSRYIPQKDLEEIKSQINLCKQYQNELPKVKSRLNDIEKIANLYDKQIERNLILIRVSAGMDNLTLEQRRKSVSFARSMNSLDGVPISESTDSDLKEWESGNKSYLDTIKAVLNRYGVNLEV